MKTRFYRFKICKNSFIKNEGKPKWETSIDFTKIKKGGIKIRKLLSVFKTLNIS
jgi:hypothetical protein